MGRIVDDLIVSPKEAIPDGVEKSLSEAGLSVKAADFGESVKKGTLVKTSVGVVMVDREPETRTITLKLEVRADVDVTLPEAAHNLEAIVGELQERDNWIRRDFHVGGDFGSILYHVSGEVSLSDFAGWQVGASPDVTLAMVCDFAAYSTEEVESEEFKSVEGERHCLYELPPSEGTTKGLKRIRVTNEGDEDLRGLVQAEECRDYKPEDPTAEMVYAAKDLTLKGGSEVETVEGEEVVAHNALTAGRLAILGSEIDGVGHMTHRGARKVRMWVEQPTGAVGDVKMQLLSRPLGASRWDEGGPIISPYAVGGLCLVDLGVHRPQMPSVGEERWEWALIVWAPGGSGGIRIWDVYPLPTEQYAECSEPLEAPAADALTAKSPGTAANDSSHGTTAWTNPNNAKASDGSYASALLAGGGGVSQLLKVTNFGFGLPEGATVVDIVVSVERKAEEGACFDNRVSIVKGGAVGSLNVVNPLDASESNYWPATDAVAQYPAGLWGETWSVADINASDFGIAISVWNRTMGERTVYIDHISITVYYAEAETDDFVCAASRSIELASDGVARQHRTADVWGGLTPDGFPPYDTPGGSDERPSRGLLIPARGDFQELPDLGPAPISTVVKTRQGSLYARLSA